jgi:hypothetical protein
MRFTTLALAASVIALPFAAANAQQAPPGYEQGPPEGYEQGPPPGYSYDQGQQSGYEKGQKHEFRHLLSREQHAMLREEIASQGTDGGKKQIKQAVRQQLQQIASMSPGQQTQERNQLQAEWNALPSQEKQQLEQQIAERREQHKARRQNGQSHAQGSEQYGPQAPQQYAPQGQPAQYNSSNDDDDDQ